MIVPMAGLLLSVQIGSAEVDIRLRHDGVHVSAAFHDIATDDALVFLAPLFENTMVTNLVSYPEPTSVDSFASSLRIVYAAVTLPTEVRIRYDVSVSRRTPFFVPSVPFAGARNAVTIRVTGLSDGLALNESFPRLRYDASAREAATSLANMPSFFLMPPPDGTVTTNVVVVWLVIILVGGASGGWMFMRYRSRPARMQ